jgi:nicotinamidase-related amidase
MPYDDQHDPYANFRGARANVPGSTGTALVVIDMQNTFLHPEGSFARLGVDTSPLREAIPGCVRLAEGARAAGVPVINVMSEFRPDYRDGGIIFNEIKRPIQDVEAMVAGSWDARIVDELAPHPDDFLVRKLRFSAFYATTLEVVLTSLEVNNLVVCGVTTNICVESTARDAAQRNYRTFVASDAAAEIDPAKHDHALTTLEYAFCRVVTVDEILAGWSLSARSNALPAAALA